MPSEPADVEPVAPTRSAGRLRHAFTWRKLRGWHLAVLVVAILAPMLYWMPYLSRLSISGEIVARSVTMTLPNGLALEPGLQLDARQSIRLGGYTSSEGVDAPDNATLRSERATELAEINLARGATLSMSFRPARARYLLQVLAFNGASIAIDQMQSSSDADAGAEPELVRVSAAPGSAVPLRMQATLGGGKAENTSLWADQLMLTDVAVTDLRFGEESRGQADHAFVSSIASGKITLIETDKTLSLSAAAPLAMSGFRGTLTRVALQADGFHVLFSGTLDRLGLGPVGFPTDQTPTMLDFVLNNPLIRAVLATVVWLGGVVPTLYGLKKEQK